METSRAQKVAMTKLVWGVCVDPQSDKRVASFFEVRRSVPSKLEIFTLSICVSAAIRNKNVLHILMEPFHKAADHFAEFENFTYATIFLVYLICCILRLHRNSSLRVDL